MFYFDQIKEIPKPSLNDRSSKTSDSTPPKHNINSVDSLGKERKTFMVYTVQLAFF